MKTHCEHLDAECPCTTTLTGHGIPYNSCLLPHTQSHSALHPLRSSISRDIREMSSSHSYTQSSSSAPITQVFGSEWFCREKWGSHLPRSKISVWVTEGCLSQNRH